MKHFALSIALGLAAVSCTPDRDTVAEVNNQITQTSTLPVKFKVVNKNKGVVVGDPEFIEIKYNGDKISELFTADEKYSFEYKGDLITSLTKKTSKDGNGKWDYVYDENNRLVEERYTDRDDSIRNKHTTFQYKSDGTVLGTLKENRNPSDLKEYTYTLSNGNLVKKVYRDKYGNSHTTEYKYDTKNAPFKNVKGLSAIILTEFYTPEFGNNNNLIEVRTQYFRGSSPSDLEILTYTFDYNADNFPVKRTSKIGSDEEDIFEYYYNK